jgi:hypothetical protein
MDTRLFALFFVGLCLVAGGTTAYAVTFDQDWRVTAFVDEDADSGVAYESLGEERQATVDEALGSTTVVVDDRSERPPGLVEKDGTVYAFKVRAATDYSEAGHPVHFPALGAALAGVVLVGESIRRDHVPHWRPWRRLVPSGDEN